MNKPTSLKSPGKYSQDLAFLHHGIFFFLIFQAHFLFPETTQCDSLLTLIKLYSFNLEDLLPTLKTCTEILMSLRFPISVNI